MKITHINDKDYESKIAEHLALVFLNNNKQKYVPTIIFKESDSESQLRFETGEKNKLIKNTVKNITNYKGKSSDTLFPRKNIIEGQIQTLTFYELIELLKKEFNKPHQYVNLKAEDEFKAVYSKNPDVFKTMYSERSMFLFTNHAIRSLDEEVFYWFSQTPKFKINQESDVLLNRFQDEKGIENFNAYIGIQIKQERDELVEKGHYLLTKKLKGKIIPESISPF